ncbi:hypothetical protein [Flavimarina sp. Hel_I_48]|uniref:hypothetical protein n=1 Tax=Flavimarina sp. Hel_I_48 TaxID=1392488 RepID=UPI0004DF522F|nr:hypothetical protein [Flavimarina sp. Hel_I_48]
MGFEKNVFINCPFDNDYRILIKPLIFTLLYLDFNPKLSQTFSSATIRINGIKDLIRDCKYGIHDLSRSKPLSKGDLPRFNMPYELGLDIGAMEYGSNELKNKKILILETEKYYYQKVLSDIAGQDIENHNDEPYVLITKVRNWLSANLEQTQIEGQRVIWNSYNQFIEDLTTQLINSYTNQEIEEIPIADFIKFAKDWIYELKL